MVIPILMLPGVFVFSFGTLTIPELSAYLSNKNYKKINWFISKIFKSSFIFCFGVLGVFWLFSDKLSSIVYNDISLSHYIIIMAPLRSSYVY